MGSRQRPVPPALPPGRLPQVPQEPARASQDTCPSDRNRQMDKIAKKNGRFVGLASVAGIALGVAFARLHAEGDQPAPRWKTGTEFQEALLSPMGDVFFSPGTPLRQALERLAAAQGVALMLDRRLDPGEIEIAARDTCLASVLDHLAAQCGGTVSHIGAVAYMGPRGGPRICPKSRDSDGERRSNCRGRCPGVHRRPARRWDVLTVPRALLDDLAAQAGLAIEGIELLPHDLWPAVDLPPLAWTDRMTLVLAGFDLTFQYVPDGKRVRLVPLVPPDLITRTYPTTATPEQLHALAAEFPTARLHPAGQGIVFEGTVEEHERFEQYGKGAATGRTGPRAGQGPFTVCGSTTNRSARSSRPWNSDWAFSSRLIPTWWSGSIGA